MKGKIEATVLKAFSYIFVKLGITDIRVEVRDDGWYVSAVDPGHVMIAEVLLSKNGWKSYDFKPKVFALDIDKLYRYAQDFKKGEVIEISLEDTRELECSFFLNGSLVRTFKLPSEEEIRAKPKIPELEYKSEITLLAPQLELIKSVLSTKLEADLGNEIGIGVVERTPGEFELCAFAEDDVGVRLKSCAPLERAENYLVIDPCASVYSIDLFKSIFSLVTKDVGASETVTIRFAFQYPLKLSYEHKGIEVAILLAPHVSDEENGLKESDVYEELRRPFKPIEEEEVVEKIVRTGTTLYFKPTAKGRLLKPFTRKEYSDYDLIEILREEVERENVEDYLKHLKFEAILKEASYDTYDHIIREKEISTETANVESIIKIIENYDLIEDPYTEIIRYYKHPEQLEKGKIELEHRVDALSRYFFGGYGAKIVTIEGFLTYIKDSKGTEEDRDGIRKSFAWVKRKYEQIPFSELSESPYYDDYKHLFDINEILPELAKNIELALSEGGKYCDTAIGQLKKIHELGREYTKTTEEYYKELTGQSLREADVETRALMEYRSKEQIQDQVSWLKEQGIEPNSFEKAAMEYYGVEITEEEPPWRRLLDVIKELEKEHGLEVPEDIAIAAATEVGIVNLEDLIGELKRDGILYSPAKGLIARVEKEEKIQEEPIEEEMTLDEITLKKVKEKILFWIHSEEQRENTCDFDIETFVKLITAHTTFTPAFFRRTIDELKAEGVLYSPREGVIRRTECKEPVEKKEQILKESTENGWIYKKILDGEYGGSLEIWDMGEGEYKIENIDVAPAFRRRGVASDLIEEVIKDFVPYNELKWGMQTEEGAKLKEALDKKYTVIEEPKEPWMMTKDEFIEYHKTGALPDDAYEEKTVNDFEWLGQKEKHPKLIRTYKAKNGENIELRQTTEKLGYTKLDEEGEIVREKGLAVYLTDEEIQEKKLPLYDTTVVAFNEKGQPIGYASNEFGADGVWIAKEYQKQGIGVELLIELRKQFGPMRRIGQMTHLGERMALAYHRRQIEEALKEGKPVPEEVLKDYPDLIKPPEEEEIPKEPWQMTYTEFFDIAGSEYTAGERFGVPTKNRMPINPDTGYPIKGATPEERIHRAVLMKALKEGITIPEEVLKDYPDLVKKPPVPKIPEEGITEDWIKEVIAIDPKVSPKVVAGGEVYRTYGITFEKIIPELGETVPLCAIGKETIPEVEELLDLHKYEDMIWSDEDITWTDKANRYREIWYTVYAEDELRDKKVDEIKGIARIKHLSTIGKKEELIARIIEEHELKEWQDIPDLDAQIRVIKEPTKDFDRWTVEIGIFESLGEQGGDILTEYLDEKPTLQEIKNIVIQRLKDAKAEMNYPLVAKSGREEMQEEVIDKVLPTKETEQQEEIKDFGKWIRENTYGEGGVRQLDDPANYTEVMDKLQGFIKRFYKLNPDMDYIFERPKHKQFHTSINHLANAFFDTAASGWDLLEAFEEWEVQETREEFERRLHKKEEEAKAEIEERITKKELEVPEDLELIPDVKIEMQKGQMRL